MLAILKEQTLSEFITDLYFFEIISHHFGNISFFDNF